MKITRIGYTEILTAIYCAIKETGQRPNYLLVNPIHREEIFEVYSNSFGMFEFEVTENGILSIEGCSFIFTDYIEENEIECVLKLV